MPATEPPRDFEDFVNSHLDAVRRRDLPRFERDLGDEIILILPSGDKIEGREDVVEFHRNWFADPDWSMHVEPATAGRRRIPAGPSSMSCTTTSTKREHRSR